MRPCSVREMTGRWLRCSLEDLQAAPAQFADVTRSAAVDEGRFFKSPLIQTPNPRYNCANVVHSTSAKGKESNWGRVPIFDISASLRGVVKMDIVAFSAKLISPGSSQTCLMIPHK